MITIKGMDSLPKNCGECLLRIDDDADSGNYNPQGSQCPFVIFVDKTNLHKIDEECPLEEVKV